MECIIACVVITVILSLLNASGDNSYDGTSGQFPSQMNEFEVRLKSGQMDDEPHLYLKDIEARGEFPVRWAVEGGVLITAFDTTDEDPQPVLAVFEALQEEDTIAFKQQHAVGALQPGYGFTDWVGIGNIIPDLLQTPYAGLRQLTVQVFLIDMNNPPPTQYGGVDVDHPGVLWGQVLKWRQVFDGVGYLEASENADECRGLTIHIAMAVAMADGTLDDREGYTIQAYIKRFLASIDDKEARERAKKLFNQALREANVAAGDGRLDLERYTSRLNEIADLTAKYETIKLCFDVMAADGIADPEELKQIRTVASSLDLDFDEVERMRDAAVLDLRTPSSKQASLEDLLGVDLSWDKSRIQEHIESEFLKWNGRLSAMRDPDKRAQAQRMIDLCAKAQTKYE